MLGIILFSIGVMYTPGPVNILSLNSGLQKRFRAHLTFSSGVASALFIWFILVGYAGSTIVNQHILPFVGGLGCCFILYLAYKIMTARVDIIQSNVSLHALSFKDGLLIQLLNPKTFLVVLPVTTVQFPAAGIEGGKIVIWSFVLAALGFGAPTAYAAVGTIIGRHIENVTLLKLFNILMGLLLIAVALDMAYQYVLLVIYS